MLMEAQVVVAGVGRRLPFTTPILSPPFAAPSNNNPLGNVCSRPLAEGGMEGAAEGQALWSFLGFPQVIWVMGSME